MKELNLTEGPWKLDDHFIYGSKPYETIAEAFEYAPEHREESKANAQAIVTAVNETYHKGIDPEGVPDMKEALKGALQQIKWDRLSFKEELGETPISCDNAIEAIESALKKAGTNLNEKAE